MAQNKDVQDNVTARNAKDSSLAASTAAARAEHEEQTTKEKIAGQLQLTKRTTAALKTLLENQNLIDSILKDVEKGAGTSLKTIAEIINFIFWHPLLTIELGAMALTGEFQKKEFQLSLLEHDFVWKFVSSMADRLPIIGSILNKLGVPGFDKDGPFSQEALKQLAPALKNEDNHNILKKATKEIISPTKEWTMAVVGGPLHILAKDKTVQQYFATYGDKIQQLAKQLYNSTANDVAKSMNRTLHNSQFSIIESTIIENIQAAVKSDQTFPQLKDPKLLSAFALDLNQHFSPIQRPTLKDIFTKWKDQFNPKLANEEQIPVILKNVETRLNLSGYQALDKLLQQPLTPPDLNYPTLKDKVADLLFQSILPPALSQEKAIANVLNLPEIQNLLNELKTQHISVDLKGFFEYSLATTKSILKENLDFYGVGAEILDHVPALLKQMPTIEEVFRGTQTVSLFQWAETALDLFKDKELHGFISQNPEFLVNVIKGVVNSQEWLQKTTVGWLQDEQLQLLDMLTPLLKKPEEAQKILHSLNQGEYVALVSTLIDDLNDKELNDPNTQGLTKTLQELAKKGIFDKLIMGVINEMEKWYPNEPDKQIKIRTKLAEFGLKDPEKEIPRITKIFPILLDQPATLKEVFGHFKEGNYTGMAKVLIANMAKAQEGRTQAGIREYLLDNKALFAQVLNNVLKGYELQDDLLNILPDLLNHPAELVKMIEQAEKGNYGTIGQQFLYLTKVDPKIKTYFEKNSAAFHKIAVKAGGLEAYNITKDIADIFKVLMNDKNRPELAKLFSLYQENKQVELVREICLVLKNNPDFANYIKQNEQNFAEIIVAAIDKTPALKSMIGPMELGAGVSTILTNPHNLNSILKAIEAYEAYQSGHYGTMAKHAASAVYNVASLKNISAVAGIVSSALLPDATRQNIVNMVTNVLGTRDTTAPGNQLLALSEIVNASVDTLSKSAPKESEAIQKLLKRNVIFDDVTIEGTVEKPINFGQLKVENTSFFNSKIAYVTFKGTKFINCSFVGTEFGCIVDDFTGEKIRYNVDFAGAIIDAATFATMLPQLRQGTISISGASIVGDLSGLDLSGVSLKDVNLSGVTSFKNTNLNGTDLTGATLPAKLELLTEAYNINNAIFNPGVITKELLEAQKVEVINKVVDKIAAKDEHMKSEAKAKLAAILQTLSKNPDIGSPLLERLQKTPDSTFPTDPKTYKDISDLSSTSALLTTIYNNKHRDVNALKNMVAADLIAEKISKQLFGITRAGTEQEFWHNGTGHGQDAQMIRTMMKSIVHEFTKANPDANITELLNRNTNDEPFASIARELYAKSKYTVKGLNQPIKEWGTIDYHLTQEMFNDKQLDNKIITILKHNCIENDLTKEEFSILKKIAGDIGSGLFGESGAKNDRADDTGLILATLKKAVSQIKTMDKNFTVTEDYVSSLKQELTTIFEKNSSYTKTGLLTAGINALYGGKDRIYLDPAKLERNKVIETVKTKLQNNMQKQQTPEQPQQTNDKKEQVLDAARKLAGTITTSVTAVSEQTSQDNSHVKKLQEQQERMEKQGQQGNLPTPPG